MTTMTGEEIEAPNELETAADARAVAEAARLDIERTARAVKRLCPDCNERDVALTHLQEAAKWARLAVMRKLRPDHADG